MKSAVMQFIPDLARAGLIKNEPWVIANANAAEVMFSQPLLSAAAIVIAAVHPTGLDVLEQAPIIAALHANGMDKRVQREVLARDFRQRLQLLPKLRDLLESLSIPKQLRGLRPHALSPEVARIIPHLADVHPSTLAQSMPANDIPRQKDWLVAIYAWVDHFTRRNNGEVPHLDWLLKNADMSVLYLSAEVATVADFAIANPDRFNTRWTWARALTAANDWHRELQRGDAERDFARNYGRHVDYQVDYGHLSKPYSLPGGFSIVPLRSGRDLIEEGKTLHHCVASYARDVLNGQSRIFSIRKSGKPVATLELARQQQVGTYRGKPMCAWRTVQLQGPCNDPVSEDVRNAVQQFIDANRYQTWVENLSAQRRPDDTLSPPRHHPHIVGDVPPSGRAGYGGRGLFHDHIQPTHYIDRHMIVPRDVFARLRTEVQVAPQPNRENPLRGASIGEFSGVRITETRAIPHTLLADLENIPETLQRELNRRMERVIFHGADIAYIPPTSSEDEQ